MSDDIKKVIAETIEQVHNDDSMVRFRRPTTLQGWVYVVLGLGSVIAFMWTSVVFLHRVSKHPDQPHHEGTAKVLQEIKEQHRTDAELKLTIMEQTQPIQQKVDVLRDDVSRIQTSVDILVEDSRERRREGR